MAPHATEDGHLYPGLQWPTDKPLDGRHEKDTTDARHRSSTTSSQTCCSADDSPSHSHDKDISVAQDTQKTLETLVPSLVDLDKPAFSSSTSPSSAKRRKAAGQKHLAPEPAASSSSSRSHSHSRSSPSTHAPSSPRISRQSSFEASSHKFPRISRPVELLRPSYDCVVIDRKSVV